MNDTTIQTDLPNPSLPPVEPRSWYQIWWAVWRHPGIATFRSLLAEPKTGPSRAFLWTGLTALIIGLLGSIINAIFYGSARMAAWNLVCSVFATPLFAILAIALSNGIYHFIAHLFGGTGKWEQLIFCSAAVQAPAALIGLVSYLNYPAVFASNSASGRAALALPLVCLSTLFVIMLSLYALVLYIFAVAAAENLSIGKAVATVIIPTMVVFVFFACLAAIGFIALRNVQYTPGLQG